MLPLLIPGCRVHAVETSGTTLVIPAQTILKAMPCPVCNQYSARVHRSYQHCLRDLPVFDQHEQLQLLVRRFFCINTACARGTLAEPLPEVAPRYARRTPRLTQVLRLRACAAGAEAGARATHHLHMTGSGDTLLRIMRATSAPPLPPPQILDVDDCAFRKGRTYGTILVNLEQHRPIAILPDRAAETLANWLREHPRVQIITRNRALDYARGAANGAPHALQVADRFHLVCHMREAVERMLVRLRPALRQQQEPDNEAASHSVAPAMDAMPPRARYAPGPSRQRIPVARQQARRQCYELAKTRAAQGCSLRQIAQECAVTPTTIRSWLQSDMLPPDRRGYRASGKIDPFVAYLHQRLAEGCTNQSRLWREICEQGFTGTRSLVSTWIRAQRDTSACTTPRTRTPPLPCAQQLSWVILRRDAERTREAQTQWQRMSQQREVVEGATLVQWFLTMVRERQAATFDAWLTACQDVLCQNCPTLPACCHVMTLRSRQP